MQEKQLMARLRGVIQPMDPQQQQQLQADYHKQDAPASGTGLDQLIFVTDQTKNG